MPCYLYQASYIGAVIKTLVGNPQYRTGPAKAAIEANGGTISGCGWLLGVTTSWSLRICLTMLPWRCRASGFCNWCY